MKQDYSFLPASQLQTLLDELIKSGYQCIGPQVQDNAIVYQTLSKVSQLPKGVTQSQTPGQYTLQVSDQEHFFAWANGPQAIKPYIFSPQETIWQSTAKVSGGFEYTEVMPENEKLAFIGVRSCDIAALYIQDKHFLQEQIKDPYYAVRRQNNFIVAVNCTHPADTCFCASTGDGPEADYGYDLALTEIPNGFLIHAHSPNGNQVLDALNLKEADSQQVKTGTEMIEQAARQQQRSLPSKNLQATLFANLQHAQWEDIAERCLSCGNCTAVCPTCFCHSQHDEAELDGITSRHVRQWDSCFTPGHSYIHGITIRAATSHRYRQWLTHKLGGWHEQYGRSGCVGCGRCITWCPVGIDMTAEVSAICGEPS
jgi:sulfhydrogenase subunit beta (sulfur reductase)